MLHRPIPSWGAGIGAGSRGGRPRAGHKTREFNLFFAKKISAPYQFGGIGAAI